MKTPNSLAPARSSAKTYLLAVIAIAAVVAAATYVMRSGAEPGTVAADSVSAPPSAPAAAAYIKFDGIDGEAKDSNHKDWIDILSVSHGITRPISSGASGSTRQRGSVTFGDIVVVKEIDKSSPKLQEAIATGQVFPEFVLDLTSPATRGSSEPYLQWELKNVQVTSYRVSGAASGEDRPTETISLNYEEIRVVYTEADATGTGGGKVEYSWKVEEGVK